MDAPPVPDELLADIFLRLPTPADLVRASAACISFSRVVTHRSFLRQYRKLHAPPLLGFLTDRAFHPAVPPHPSGPAAGAVARARDADFSFSFLPPPACDWLVRDSRDGRVLLNRTCLASREIAVCDPLHRRYLVLPLVPEDLALLKCEAFLIPADNNEDASFRVVWMGQGKTKLFALVFSSSTGQWRAVPPMNWSDLFAGLISSTEKALFYVRNYAYGCFYWVTSTIYWKQEMKLLVFNTHRMEFSIAEPPPEAKSCSGLDKHVAMVEAGEGRPGMFVLESNPCDTSLHYTIMQNNGESSSQWKREKTISLSSGCYFLSGSVGRYLLLRRWGKPSFEQSCLTLDIKTFKFQRMCGEQSGRAYCNFPPLLLSSPTVSSGTPECAEAMLEQGVEALRVGEAIHADVGELSGVSRTGNGTD